MAVHSLKPATDRRLGEPLPHQLANQTRVHPIAINLWRKEHAPSPCYAVLAAVSSCCPPLWGRLPTRYSPVRHSVITIFPPKSSVGSASFDLHVLSTPPAFILSQDQTLKLKCLIRQDSAWLIRSVSTPTSLYGSFTGVPSPVSRVGTFFMNIQKNIQELLKLLCFVYSSENCLNFQGCFTVQLSRFVPTFLWVSAALFLFFTASANIILSNIFHIVNTFFNFFSTFF